VCLEYQFRRRICSEEFLEQANALLFATKSAGHHAAIEESLGSTGTRMLQLVAKFEEALVQRKLAKRLQVSGRQSGTDQQQV
jgi:hypothetical protein